MSKDNKKPLETPAEKAAPQSWNDNMADALPRQSLYFDAVRTDAYENKNGVADYIEFWVAMQVDKGQDKWRVMHYVIFDLDKEDGKFRAEVASKADCSFPEAVWHLAKFNSMASVLGRTAPTELTVEKFPHDKFPELKVYFFDIEHYKTASNIEQIAFDEADHPYRRIAGKVFADATFKRSEIKKSILGAELARQNPIIAQKIEDGILSDIFNSASGPNASLDQILQVGKALACMDEFAIQLGAFYLGVQQMLNRKDKFDKLQTLSPEEKVTLYTKASSVLTFNRATYADIVNYVIPAAGLQLDKAQDLGIHVEPFQKHLAECELYLHLLNASQKRTKFQDSLQSAHGADMGALDSLQKSVSAAQDKFIQLGGTAEQFDRLQAWVANDKKETLPPWVTGWFDRYYDQRQKAMKKIQTRQAGVGEIKTMSAKVKPPIVE